MNTILLQKILDILTEGLAHVGDFFKDLFVSDPQDGQVIAYDAETGHWINKAATEVELDLTNTFEAQPIATLTDAAENVSMKSLVVGIVPKQASGTPTPENPLPISGTYEVVITHTGKNLVADTIDGYTVSSNGSMTSSGQANSLALAPVKAGVQYTLTTEDATGFVGGFFTEKPTTTSTTYNNSRVVSSSKTFTAPIDGWVAFRMSYQYATPQLETGTTATTYEPYTATTFTKELPSTVYGGEVDVENGKLVITHAMKNISDLYFDTLSTPASHIFRSNYVQYLSGIKCPNTNNDIIGSISEQASEMTYTQISASDNGKYALSNENTNRFVMIDTACSTVSDFITAHGNDKIVYPLATPIEIDLTPTTIKTKGGTESIFADCGNVSGEYYTKTAESVIALANITEDITDQVTVNTTDWSSLQYKVVKNNKVVTIYLYSATTTEHGSVELFSGLPRAAYNGPVLLFDTDNNAVVNAKVDTSGYLDITMAAGGTVKGTITYVAK